MGKLLKECLLSFFGGREKVATCYWSVLVEMWLFQVYAFALEGTVEIGV